MQLISSDKVAADDRKYPHIVALWVAGRGLDIELNCQIMNFHKVRHIQLRHGRNALPKGGGELTAVGAFPIWIRRNPSLNSLAEKSTSEEALLIAS